MELREYQLKDVERIMGVFKADPNAHIMYQLPTGGGKTEVGLAVVQEFLGMKKQVIWHSERQELHDQTHARAWGADIPCCNSYRGCEGHSPHEDSALISVRCHPVPHSGRPSTRLGRGMSVQSIGKVANQLKQVRDGALKIFDEAHHSPAATWKKLMEGYEGPILGLTATPWRLSKKEGFDHLFTDLICGPQADWLVSNGYLSPLRVWQSPRGRRSIRDDLKVGAGGDYVLDKSFDTSSRVYQSMMEQPITDWLENDGMKANGTIVYSANVQTALDQANILKNLGLEVGFLAHKPEARLRAKMSGIVSDREDVVAGLKNGSLQVVLNVNIITEGFDAPAVERIVMGRPTMSKALAFQMMGRGMRMSDGKEYCLVIDSVENCTDPQIGLPTNEQEWSLAPRATPKNMPPPARRCQPQGGTDGCGAVIHTASHNCPQCYQSQGSECFKCHFFRLKYWGPGQCEYCNQEEAQATAEIEAMETVCEFRRAELFRDNISGFLGGGESDSTRLDWLVENNRWVVYGVGIHLPLGVTTVVKTKQQNEEPKDMDVRCIYTGPFGSGFMRKKDASNFLYHLYIQQHGRPSRMQEYYDFLDKYGPSALTKEGTPTRIKVEARDPNVRRTVQGQVSEAYEKVGEIDDEEVEAAIEELKSRPRKKNNRKASDVRERLRKIREEG